MILTGLALVFSLAALRDEPKPVATFRGLGYFKGGIDDSKAYGVSADGKTVVGTSYTKFGPEAFMWTAKDGIKGLGVLFEPVHISEATAISPDGSAVVGYSYDLQGKVAFKWTEKDGMVSLGRFRGAIDTTATAVSDSGGTIVGTAKIPQQSLTFTISSFYVSQGAVLPKPPTPSTISLLASQIGFIGGTGVGIKPWEGDIPRFEFFMTQDPNPGDLLFFVKYQLAGLPPAPNLYFTGPVSALGRRSLDSIDLTGVTRAGTEFCGTISSWHENDVVQHSDTDFAPGTGQVTCAFYAAPGRLVRLAAVDSEASSHASAIAAGGKLVVGWSQRHSIMGDSESGMRAEAWYVPSGGDVGVDADLNSWGTELFTKGDAPETVLDDVIGDRHPHSLGGALQRELNKKPGIARAVSADGEVVAGDCIGFHSQVAEPFITTKRSGRFMLSEYLQRHCPKEIAGWTLRSVRAISSDGRTFVGWGENPKGKTEAWMATIGDPRRPQSELFPPVKKPDDVDPDDGG